MFQFLVALAVFLLFYGWIKALPPCPKIKAVSKRKRSRRKCRKQRQVEEDCFYEDDDDFFKDDDWRSDLAYSGMAGNYYNHD